MSQPFTCPINSIILLKGISYLWLLYQMIKFIQSTQYINKDLHMYHYETNTPALARTSNLNEELGQVISYHILFLTERNLRQLGSDVGHARIAWKFKFPQRTLPSFPPSLWSAVSAFLGSTRWVIAGKKLNKSI